MVKFPVVKYLPDSINLHSHGPVSSDVPVQGLFPLNSICRCRISALQVPAHAPQLSHVVQSPSSEIQAASLIKQSKFCCFQILTLAGSCFSVSASAWHVTIVAHVSLPCISVAGA